MEAIDYTLLLFLAHTSPLPLPLTVTVTVSIVGLAVRKGHV
jgi:hypothetical protein